MNGLTAAVLTLSLVCASEGSAQYRFNNDFVRDAFPAKVSERQFSIPLSPENLMVVYPAAAVKFVPRMQALLRQKCGRDIPFQSADQVGEAALRSHDLIIVGNISNNPWALALYKRRYAFADAYFPGKGGVAIHPAKSLWARERRVLVIGVSTDADVVPGFERFVALLQDRAAAIPPLRLLETRLAFPKPPASVASLLENSRNNPRTAMAPYGAIADWGLSYHLTGDRRWAEYFLEGFRLCYERAESTGRWIPEPWTNVYFNLWKMVYAWELIDDDPLFAPADRKLIDEVLWGYARFSDWLPNLDPEMAPLDEPRQNHTTFLGLSLYYAHRYFTQKYGISGLDSFVAKYKRAFDRGEASSYRPNDDAGGYVLLAPLHLLTYQMAENQDSFMASGKLRQLADLVFTILDNRNDVVSFGDVGGYTHRPSGARRGLEAPIFGMAAWRYRDPEYQWLYRWNTSASGSNRADPLRFTLEELYTGSYAVAMKERAPQGIYGVHPVILDRAALGWSARRSERKEDLPVTGVRYIDKLSFRTDLDPEHEYLLLDGTSTFSHGHYDGNTVTRLTWKDRVWLFESDYIKLTPKYHMGVVITRDGVQEDPPPLTALDFDAEFGGFGFARTSVRDYNGCDWARNIIWSKGRYFLFLDELRARREGEYRFESRWRSLGDARCEGNRFTVRQGEATFHITSGDDAARTILYEPGPPNYPGANGRTAIDYARKEVSLPRGGRYVFANLMSVDETGLAAAGGRLYVVADGGEPALAGTDARALAAAGVRSDAALVFAGSGSLSLLKAKSVRLGGAAIDSSAPIHLHVDFATSKGILAVPGGEARLTLRGVRIGDAGAAPLKPGRYPVTFTVPLPALSEYVAQAAGRARQVRPSPPPRPVAAFGFAAAEAIASAAPISAFSQDGTDLLYGDRNGGIRRVHANRISPLGALASGRPVTVIHSSDINADGSREVLAGDDAQNVYCYTAGGNPLWTHRLNGYYGRANPTYIATADLDGGGQRAVLVATAAWKLYAFNGDGSLRWAGFTKYHPQTMVKFLKSGGEEYVAVGTTYETPLNVLSARDGRLLWHTWEEMGSEFLSKTQYCGIHLTDMLFLDVDGDRRQDIVFGGKSNRIFAIDSANGATKWQANVGDEVNALALMADPGTGESMILVATEGGDLLEYDRGGRRRQSLHVGSAITGMAVLPHSSHGRSDIALSTGNGTVIICDDSFRIRAASNPGGRALLGLTLGEASNGENTIYAISEKGVEVLRYRPFFLKESRDY